MQPLLDGPRSPLTKTLVRNLLQSHSAITVSYGATALNSSFAEVADIADYISGGTITSDITATTHRTCSVDIDSDVTDSGWSYLSGFIKPYMVLTDNDTQDAAQFNLGVYTLTTPDETLGTAPATLSFTGYDLKYLLNQQIGDSYEVLAGSDPAQAAADAIGLAVPEVDVLATPSGSTLTRQMTWPFDPSSPTTWLTVVQDLLASIGYREVWVDWEGTFRIQPYIDVQTAPFEWTFDVAADDNIVADLRQRNVDLWNVPNWWRFVMANLSGNPVEGESQFTYTDSSNSNPGSTKNRGRTFRHIESVTANTYDDLLNYAQRVISDDLQPSETFSVSTAPFPLAWHMDIIQYLDSQLAISLPQMPTGERRVVATQWSLPLDGMADMTWTWQTVTDQTAELGLASTDEAGSAGT